ncbi:MAG TPA: type II toxin-antitoxin system prevent-host-death family antitoxin [Micromonosporaceae bacterium]|nr:type II toxin-antitoxin system prevent-host-death family antitoxin [Micromonosporaceae bacterium]
MAKRRIMGAQEVRSNFSDRLDAASQGEHTVVLRRSAPDAVLVPARWYSQACEAMGDPWEDWVPPPEPDDASDGA